MVLTYNEYQKIIPKKTGEYVDKLLEYVFHYICLDNDVISYNNYYSKSNNVKLQISALLSAALNDEINIVLFSGDFIREKIKDYSIDDHLSYFEKEWAFKAAIPILFPYEDITKYQTINEYDIMCEAMALIRQDDYFTSLGITKNLKKVINNQKNIEDVNKDIMLEKELHNLSSQVFLLFEMASKVRSELIELFSKNKIIEHELLKNNDSYLVPISILYALFMCDELDKTDIINYFSINGLTYNNFIKLFPSLINASKRPRNLESVKSLYVKYATKSCEDKNSNDNIDIYDVLENLFNKDFVGLNVIDKMLDKLKIEKNKFVNLKSNVLESSISIKKQITLQKYKELYQDLNINTKNFINFVTQTYELLKEKMKDNKYNNDLITCDDDLDTLSLLIASYFYDTRISQFYIENGITFDKILELLKINITKEEIDKIAINQKNTVDIFAKFIIDGVNKNKKKDLISIEDVCNNLCNREFNKSMIMENIFESIRNDIDLPENFLHYMDKYFEKKELDRKEKLKEEFFKNKDEEYSNFIKITYAYYALLKKYANNIDKDTLIYLSLLSVILSFDGIYEKYLRSISLTKSKIFGYCGGIYENHEYVISCYQKEIDINLIVNEIMPFIDKLYKNDKIEYKVNSIFQHLINKDNILIISDFLKTNSIELSDFDNIEEKLELIHQEELRNERNKVIDKFVWEINENLKDTLFIACNYLDLINVSTNDNILKLSDDEKKGLSVLLGYLSSGLLQNVFDKYNIDIHSILEFYGLPYIVNKSNNNTKLFDNYRVLFQENNTLESDKLLFNAINNNQSLNDLFEKLEIEYKFFLLELKNGKDYDENLSLDEKIQRLKKKPIKDIGNDVISISKYGSDLVFYTKYLNESFSNLVPDGSELAAVKKVEEIIDNIYKEEQGTAKKQSFWEILIGKEEVIEKKVFIDDTSLDSLQKLLNDELVKLKNGLISTKQTEEYSKILLDRIDKYRDILKNKIATIEIRLKNCSDPIDGLELKTLLTGYKSKLSNLDASYGLVYNYIVRACLFMQNTLVTASSIQMSRDVLLPLLKFESQMAKEIDNQKNSYEIIKGLQLLMSQVINQNTEGIKLGLKTLSESNFNLESMELIEQNVNLLLQEISKEEEVKLELNTEVPIQLIKKLDDQKN